MEVVSFLTFLEGKISELLFQIFFLSGIVFLLIFYDVDSSFIILSAVLFLSAQISFLWFSFQKKQKDSQRIINLADELQESYYISDILPKPGDPQNKAYYYALKKACKAMNDKISQIEKEKQEYEEYVESFAHEIKIPIGALSLTFDNTKNYALKKETDKLYRLTEQMLYYARSESTEKDYFVKKLNLEEVIHNVILKFRHDLIDHKVIIETHAIDQIVYTDEKWLTFILSQIIQNSIKYFDKQENKLTITGQDNDTNIILSIKDNGCGISSSDLSRVFEKGFTGSDRRRGAAGDPAGKPSRRGKGIRFWRYELRQYRAHRPAQPQAAQGTAGRACPHTGAGAGHAEADRCRADGGLCGTAPKPSAAGGRQKGLLAAVCSAGREPRAMAAGYAAPRRLRSAAGRGHKLAALWQSRAGCSPDPCLPRSGTARAAAPEASPTGQGAGGAFAAGTGRTGCGLVLYRRRPCRPASKAAKPWRRKPAPRRGKAGVSAALALSLSIEKTKPGGFVNLPGLVLRWRPRCDSNTRPSA